MSSFKLFRIMHLRQLVRQPLRTVLAVVAVAAGVSLTIASTFLVQSVDRSIGDVLKQMAGGAPLRVVGPLFTAGLDERVASKVSRVEGVAAAVPLVHAVTVAERAEGHEINVLAVGLDCRVEAIIGDFGCDAQTLSPSVDGPVLISPNLKRSLGRGGVIRTDMGRVAIDDVVTNDSLDDMNRGRVVVFALPTAQRLFGRLGRLDQLYVQPKPGASIEDVEQRIERSIGAWNVVLRRDELPDWATGSGPLVSLLAFAAILALGLSGLLVYNIVALTLAERRRDIAVASAVGAHPRAITTGAVGEAVIVGLVGGAVGSLVGLLLGRVLVGYTSRTIYEPVLGIPLQVHLSIAIIAIGVALGGVVAAVAAFVPARRARRIDVAAELHGRAPLTEVTSRRLTVRLVVLIICGVASLALSYVGQSGGGLEPWQPALASYAMLGAAIFAFAAAAAATPLLLGLGLARLRRRGGALRLAVANVVAQPRRTSVLAAAVASAVGMACVLGAVVPTIRSAVRGTTTGLADGRVYVTTLSINYSSGVSARISPSVLAKLEAIDGVASVDRGYDANVSARQGFLGINAVDGRIGDPYERVAGEVGDDVLERGEAIVGTSAARRFRVRVGSMLRFPTPTGFAEVRVGGIWASTENNGNSAFVSASTLERLFGRTPAGAAFVAPEAGVDPADLKRRIMDASLDPDVYALTPDELGDQLADEVALQVSPFWVLQRILLFVALIGTLSTLLLMGVQRRRELGVLGAAGFGPGALARMTLSEAVAAAVVGALLGAIGSLGVFEALRNAASVIVGQRPSFGFSTTSAVLATLLALLVVGVGAILPAWRTSRLQIVEAIRDE